MNEKLKRIFPMVVVICIGSMIIIAGFVRYSNKLKIYFEKQIEQELKDASLKSINKFDDKINNIVVILKSFKYTLQKYDIEKEVGFIRVYLMQQKSRFGMNKIEYFSDVDYYMHIKNNEERQKIISTLKKGDFIVYTKEDNDMIKLVIAVPYIKDNKLFSVITTSLSEDDLDEILSFSDYGGKNELHIIQDDGHIFKSNTLSEYRNYIAFLKTCKIYNNYTISDFKRVLEDEEYAFIEYKFDNQNWYAQVLPIRYGDLFLLNVISSEQTAGISSDMYRLSIILSLQIFSAVIVLISYLFINSYKNLQKYIQRNKELETFTNNIPSGMATILFDNNFTVVYANDDYYEIAGYTKKEYNDKFKSSPLTFVYNEDKQKFLKTINKQHSQGNEINVEFRIICKDGNIKWCLLNAERIHNINGYPAYQCLFVDNTNNKLASIAATKAKQEVENITNSINGAVISMDNEIFDINYANTGFFKIINCEQKLFKTKYKNSIRSFIHSDDVENVYDGIRKSKITKSNLEIEFRIKGLDQEYIWVHLSGRCIEENDNTERFFGVMIDVTQSKNFAYALEIEKERYRIVSNLSEGILFEYNIKNDFMKSIEKFREIFKRDIFSQNYLELTKSGNNIYFEDKQMFISNFEALKEGIDNIDFDVRILAGTNNYIWCKIQGATIYTDNHVPISLIGKITNIDKQKREIEELRDKSLRDSLTNLYNKISVEDIINEFLFEEGKDKKHTFMMIDIDNFKAVNDSLGHIFGDAVLTEITLNLKNIFTDGSIIGRIGGDEFVVFIKDINYVDEIKQKAEEICNVFRNTYAGEYKNHKISASIGISNYPKDGYNFQELFKKADIAIYSAKTKGKDRYEIYNDDMIDTPILNENQHIKEDNFTSEKRKFVYENIITNVTEMLLETKDIHSAIKMILRIVGKRYNTSRVYIFELSDDNIYISNTYEWCDNPNRSVKDGLQNIKYSIMNDYKDLFNDEGLIFIPDLDELRRLNPEGAKYFKHTDAKAIVQCKISDQSIFKGFIGYDDCDNARIWNKDEIKTLSMLSKLLGSYLLRLQTEKKLKIENQITQAIYENQQLYTYIIDKDTFELLYINNNTKINNANVKKGEICYKAFRGLENPCNNCPALNIISDGNFGTAHFYDKNLKQWIGLTASKIDFDEHKNSMLICGNNINGYIEEMTYKDPLIGIPTVNKFKIDAEAILSVDKEINYALIYSDFDRFKYINDVFGFSVGDNVLRCLGLELYNLLEKGELICRVTDDKFLSLIKYEGDINLKERMKRINDRINKINSDIFKNFSLTIISGVYIIENYNNDISYVIDRANIARKTVKGSHKNTYAIYNDEMKMKIAREKSIENKMYKALEENEFVVYLQTKVELESEKIVGAEALVRWCENGKIIPPNDFIPLFEKNGFIADLDFFVYETIFKSIRKWLDEKIDFVPISVNISRAHIKNPKFVEMFYNLSKSYNVPVEYIEMELTESIFMDDIDIVKDTMNKFKHLGFTVSMDDFGSGYSSLNLLKELPVDILKMDKEFFRHEHIQEREATIVSNVIKMAKDLDMIVLSEGVETREQADFLRNAGCDLAQGYLFSKPIPLEDFENMLKNKMM